MFIFQTYIVRISLLLLVAFRFLSEVNVHPNMLIFFSNWATSSQLLPFHFSIIQLHLSNVHLVFVFPFIFSIIYSHVANLRIQYSYFVLLTYNSSTTRSSMYHWCWFLFISILNTCILIYFRMSSSHLWDIYQSRYSFYRDPQFFRQR